MRHDGTFVSWLLLLGLASGCGQTPRPTTPAAPRPVGQAPSARSAPSAGPAASAAGACGLETVYFAYDSALLDEQARDAIITAVSCYQRGGMPERLLLQGAADSRGTEEYNLALGYRRASSVQSLLVTLGIAPGRVSVSSIGEERAAGSDESGYRLDRKVVALNQ